MIGERFDLADSWMVWSGTGLWRVGVTVVILSGESSVEKRFVRVSGRKVAS
jgi:hypothetical protein